MTYRTFKHAVFKSWAFFFLEKHSRRFLRSDFHHSMTVLSMKLKSWLKKVEGLPHFSIDNLVDLLRLKTKAPDQL